MGPSWPNIVFRPLFTIEEESMKGSNMQNQLKGSNSPHLIGDNGMHKGSWMLS